MSPCRAILSHIVKHGGDVTAVLFCRIDLPRADGTDHIRENLAQLADYIDRKVHYSDG